MKTHNLKTIQPYFDEVKNGYKTFELRKNDRDFKVNDKLCLEEYCPVNKEYTGNEITVGVSYILKGGVYGLDKDSVIMSIKFL
jgi:hypothetical protein